MQKETKNIEELLYKECLEQFLHENEEILLLHWVTIDQARAHLKYKRIKEQQVRDARRKSNYLYTKANTPTIFYKKEVKRLNMAYNIKEKHIQKLTNLIITCQNNNASDKNHELEQKLAIELLDFYSHTAKVNNPSIVPTFEQETLIEQAKNMKKCKALYKSIHKNWQTLAKLPKKNRQNRISIITEQLRLVPLTKTKILRKK